MAAPGIRAAPLCAAAQGGFLAAAAELLAQGASPGAHESEALFAAVQANSLPLVRLLCEGVGLSPLQHSVRRGHVSPLHTAGESSSGELVAYLLARGLSAREAAPGAGMWTPLHFACNGRNERAVEAAEALLRGGALINAASDRGSTPLYLAASNGRTAMVQALCDAGASVTTGRMADCSDGSQVYCTPLMAAEEGGHRGVVRALRKAGARR